MPVHGKKYKPSGSGYWACAYWQSIHAVRRQWLSVAQITQHRWWIQGWMRVEQWRDDSIRRQKYRENPVPVPLPPPQIPHRPASYDSSVLHPTAYLLYRLRHLSRTLLSFLSPFCAPNDASSDYSMSVSLPTLMDISIHKYLLTSLQIWPIAISIRTACQWCTDRHCYRVWSLPDRSAVRKGVLSPVSENVPAFVTVRICFSAHSYCQWWMRATLSPKRPIPDGPKRLHYSTPPCAWIKFTAWTPARRNHTSQTPNLNAVLPMLTRT